VARFGQRADDLLDEERIAGRALVDQLREALQRAVLAGQVAQQLAGVVGAERRQRDLAVVRRPGPVRLVLGAEVDQSQRLRSLQRGEQLVEQHLRALVQPVQVLDHGDDRLAPVRGAHQPADDAAQRPLARLGAELGEGAVGVGDAEEVEEERQLVGELGVEQQRSPGDLLAHDPFRIAVGDAEVGAQHLQHRHEGDLAPV
jgi:hypothetical protein